MLRPPQHRADAPIVYVHPRDPAWDHDRVIRDLEGLDDHPLQLYWGGFTRYDFNHEIQSYLKPDSQPTKFHLRRLDWEKWLEAEAMFHRSVVRGDARPTESFKFCCKYGLKRIENGPEFTDPTDYEVSRRDMARLHEYSTDQYNLILDVGQAAYQASMPLSEAEKKA